MTAYPISSLQWITQLFLALPMLAIIVNNVIPRARMRHFTISLSAMVAGVQLLAALAGFALLWNSYQSRRPPRISDSGSVKRRRVLV